MPIKEIEVGTGLTKRTMRRISGPFGPEEIAALKSMLKRVSQANDLDLQLKRNEAIARAILTDAGMPDADRDILVRKDGSWTDSLPPDWQQKSPKSYLKPGEQLTSGAALAIRRFGCDSQEGYAARALQKIGFLRVMNRVGETKKAEMTVLRLADLIKEAELKFKWEPDTIVGGKVRAGGCKGGRPKRELHLKWRDYFRRVQTNDRDLSKTAIYQRVADKFDVERDAVKKALQRLEKNPTA